MKTNTKYELMLGWNAREKFNKNYCFHTTKQRLLKIEILLWMLKVSV